MRVWRRSRWTCWLPVWLGVCVAPATPGAARPYRVCAVLPAINEPGNERLAPWSLGWQALLQERLRECPGIRVARLSTAPAVIEAFVGGKFDPATEDSRRAVAAALGADLLVAPRIVGGPPTWQLAARLHDLTAGTTVDLPPAGGALPVSVVDTLALAVLRTALAEPALDLPPWVPDEIPPRYINQFVHNLTLWPYSEKSEARRGQLSAALLDLTNLGTTGSPFWLTWLRFEQTALAAGKAPLAVKVLAPWAAQHPDEARAQLLLGQAYLAAGQDTEAASALGRAATLSQFAEPPVLALTACLRRLGRGAEALGVLDKASAAWPAVPVFQSERALVAAQLGRTDVALAAAQAATTSAPGDLTARVTLVRSLLALKRLDEARPALAELRQRAPAEPSVLALAVEVALAGGQWDEAQAALAQLPAEDPAAPELKVRLAWARGDWPAVTAALTRQLAAEPTSADAWHKLVQAQLFAGQVEAAATSAERGAKAVPAAQRSLLLADQATAAFCGGRFESALALCRLTLRAAPDCLAARYLEGRVLVWRGALDDLVTSYLATLKADPGAARGGAQAIAELEGDLAHGANADATRLALGLLYDATGRVVEAKRRYREFLGVARPPALRTWVEGRLAQLETARTDAPRN